MSTDQSFHHEADYEPWDEDAWGYSALIAQDAEEEREQTNVHTNVPAMHFSSADKALLYSGEYSDAKVIANGKTYKVHKTILCTRNKWFRRAFEGGFREGREAVVEITGPENIDKLLGFLYTGAVELGDEKDIMAQANELANLGDFYLSKELKAYAAQVLGQYLGTYLTALCDDENVLGLPIGYESSHGCECLPYSRTSRNFQVLHAAGFIDRLCVALRDAYTTCPGIQQVYIDFVCAVPIPISDCKLIRALTAEVPEFGADLIVAMRNGLRPSVFDGNEAYEKWKKTIF